MGEGEVISEGGGDGPKKDGWTSHQPDQTRKWKKKKYEKPKKRCWSSNYFGGNRTLITPVPPLPMMKNKVQIQPGKTQRKRM